jgi:hypothetical protein
MVMLPPSLDDCRQKCTFPFPNTTSAKTFGVLNVRNMLCVVELGSVSTHATKNQVFVFTVTSHDSYRVEVVRTT